MLLKRKPIIFFVMGLVVLAAALNGLTAEIPARPANPVVDLAGIIEDAVEIKINGYLRELENKTGAQMAILTVKSLQGRAIEEFSLSVAHDRWKLGQKGKDNGVLLTVALNERKYRMEVGYGLEGVLPDSLVGGIGREYLVPYFKKGDYSSGIYAATLVMADKVASDAGVKITGMPTVQKTSAGKKRKDASGPFRKIISLVFFLIMLILFIKKPRTLLTLILLSSMGGRRGHWGGSGGGFGSGGFGGGGGGFGGGGATGGW